jgi:hypothetical protein
MNKNLIICTLALVLVLALIALNYQTNRVDTARAYIKVLENNYPKYIDTTSGSDEYSEWYNY